MTGLLLDSVAHILRQVLIDLGSGTDDTDSDWAVYADLLPDAEDGRDNVLGVNGTEGKTEGRVHPSGETQEKYGVQFVIRSGDPAIGWAKAARLAVALDEQIRNTVVEVGEDLNIYTVRSVTRKSGVIPLGKEPNSRRRRWTINAIASITTDEVGTG